MYAIGASIRSRQGGIVSRGEAFSDGLKQFQVPNYQLPVTSDQLPTYRRVDVNSRSQSLFIRK